METVRSILRGKGREVYSLRPDDSVYRAIEMMAEKRVGALLVVSEKRLVGIVSERDYARKVILRGKASKTTPVKEIMTSPVIYVTPDHTVMECMHVMTIKRVRHLPILDEESIVGVISIGDLVRSIITEQAATIVQLEHYIAGHYPG